MRLITMNNIYGNNYEREIVKYVRKKILLRTYSALF